MNEDSNQADNKTLYSLADSGGPSDIAEEIKQLENVMSAVSSNQRIMAAAMDNNGLDPMSVSQAASDAYDNSLAIVEKSRGPSAGEITIAQIKEAAANLQANHRTSQQAFENAVDSNLISSQEFYEYDGDRALNGSFNNHYDMWNLPASNGQTYLTSKDFSDKNSIEAMSVISGPSFDSIFSPTSPLGGEARDNYDRNALINAVTPDANRQDSTTQKPKVAPTPSSVTTVQRSIDAAMANKAPQTSEAKKDLDRASLAQKPKVAPTPSSATMVQHSIDTAMANKATQAIEAKRDANRASFAPKPKVAPTPSSVTTVQRSIDAAMANKAPQTSEAKKDLDRASLAQKPKVAPTPSSATMVQHSIDTAMANKATQAIEAKRDANRASFAPKPKVAPTPSSVTTVQRSIDAAMANKAPQTSEAKKDLDRASLAQKPKVAPTPSSATMVQHSIDTAMANKATQAIEAKRDANRASFAPKPKAPSGDPKVLKHVENLKMLGRNVSYNQAKKELEDFAKMSANWTPQQHDHFNKMVMTNMEQKNTLQKQKISTAVTQAKNSYESNKQATPQIRAATAYAQGEGNVSLPVQSVAPKSQAGGGMLRYR